MDEQRNASICELLESVESLQSSTWAIAQQQMERWLPSIERQEYLESAQNLARYLALRMTDLRSLQTQLMPWGLSSIGRCESHVAEAVDNLVATLRALCKVEPREEPHTPAQFFAGDDRLEAEAVRVFGPGPGSRRARIMVTLPSEATEYDLVRELMRRGMNVARINCAHDSEEAWAAMVANVRRAENELGLSCRIEMDLAGPKVRTAKTSFPKKQRFFKGDHVLLVPGKPDKTRTYPYQVSCTLKEVFEHAKPGDAVWIDDGLLGARVVAVIPRGLELAIEQVSVEGERIRPEKGLNFPDTPLNIPALTEKDLSDLDFVTQHADMIALSFVQTPDDVDQLVQEIARRVPDEERRHRIAIVEKIEKVTAVQNLPALIVAAAGRHPLAVMIARGDLAVEVGFQRLAEIQEEIMWICEAAQVPVVWATQVFENFVKTGLPTRAEVTDAAMSGRAECVMLNKGPFIQEAVELLEDVLIRMEGHQFKKRAELRALRSWPITIS